MSECKQSDPIESEKVVDHESPTNTRGEKVPEDPGKCLGFFKQHLMKAGKGGYDFTILY